MKFEEDLQLFVRKNTFGIEQVTESQIQLVFPFTETVFVDLFGKDRINLLVKDKNITLTKEEIEAKCGGIYDAFQKIIDSIAERNPGVEALCFAGKGFDNQSFLDLIKLPRLQGKRDIKIQNFLEAATKINEQVIVRVTRLFLSIGTDVTDGGVEFIFRKGTLLPAEKSMSYKTVFDNQEKFVSNFCEGERLLFGKNADLGSYSIENLPPGPAGSVVVTFIFSVDSNGILAVTPTIVGADNRQILAKFQLSLKQNVSEGVYDQNSILDGEKYRAQDESDLSYSRIQGVFRRLLINLGKRIKSASNIPKQKVDEIEAELTRLKHWYQKNKNKNRPIEEYEIERKKLLALLPPELGFQE